MKHLVLVSFLPFWVLVYYTLKKWPINKMHSFSMHGAVSKQSYRLYAPVVAYCAVTYWLFNVLWYIDHLQLGLAYTALMYAIAALQLLFAIVPDDPSKPSILHRNAAHIWGMLLLATFVMTLIESPTSRAQTGIVIVTLLMMLFSAGKIVGGIEKRDTYLRYQLIGIATIHLGIILLTYLNKRV